MNQPNLPHKNHKQLGIEQTTNDSAKLHERESIPDIRFVDETLEQRSEEWSQEPYGYQWPASRLSRYEMAKLTVVANTVKRPLNQLIREAVDAYANSMLIELGIAQEQIIDELIENSQSREC